MSTAFPARPELNTQPKSQAGLPAGTTCPHEVHSSQTLPKADFHFTENYKNAGFSSIEAVVTSILHRATSIPLHVQTSS